MGSEMCIRDRSRSSSIQRERTPSPPPGSEASDMSIADADRIVRVKITPPKRRGRRERARKGRPQKKPIHRLQYIKRPTFSILRRGNSYTLRATEITQGVLAQIKAFLHKKKGQVYVFSEKMTKEAAFRYIVSQLHKRNVIVTFRRR